MKYTLTDGEEMAKEFPDTFEIPSRGERSRLRAGAIVKLGFEANGYMERMWVQIFRVNNVSTRNPDYVGVLDNNAISEGMPKYGDRIPFEPRHILSI